MESNHTWRGRPLPAQNHKSRRDRERNDRETGERGERRGGRHTGLSDAKTAKCGRVTGTPAPPARALSELESRRLPAGRRRAVTRWRSRPVSLTILQKLTDNLYQPHTPAVRGAEVWRTGPGEAGIETLGNMVTTRHPFTMRGSAAAIACTLMRRANAHGRTHARTHSGTTPRSVSCVLACAAARGCWQQHTAPSV